jgi:hypothetical protein
MPRKPNGHVTRTEKAEILDFTEAALVRRLHERQILKLLLERYGLQRRQGYRYIAEVRVRWRSEATDTDRDARRDHLRKSLEDIYGKAMSPTVTKPDADVRTASRIARLLMDLDGLQAPTKVDLGGTIGVAAALVPEKSRAGLEAWLKGDKRPKP